ncbi:PREDICTED: formin-like protein 8 [Camelina sativa]|uniref:Formin-like protein n=1 Tax=Camelina sativa TaxID=90675 RepID=A0ABM0Z8X9_CAMSA|nr:PREDICTED: formin-like protein 8 [Camelina sativa]
MAAMFIKKPWPFPLHLTLIFFFFFIVPSFSQFDSPQNIETFFPIPPLSPVSPPRISPSSNSSPPSNNNNSSSSDRSTILKAVLITAASTVLVAGVFFFCLQRCVVARRRRRDRVGPVSVENNLPPYPPHPRTTAALATTTSTTLAREGFTRFGGVKGLILDENGLDVLYWRKLQSQRERSESFKKQIITGGEEEEDEKEVIYYKNKKRTEPVTEVPLLRGRSSTSHCVIHNQDHHIPVKQSEPAPPPPPPPPIPLKQSAPTPPPPPPIKKGSSPSPPPPPPVKKVGALSSSASRPPPAPVKRSSGGEGSKQVKLKPLHWDKVNPDSDHSMVWDKIDRGSFSFDGDLMEALFGYVAVGKKSPEHGDDKNPKSSSQIFILDPRKSQNTAIVLKSLGMTREELVEALMEGNDFVPDTLERLARIAPTKEEQSAILEFDGDTAKLADAESFLFHLLKSVPTAFTRLNAFLFRANYYPEMAHHGKCLQTLDLACKELRSRGLFVKLLEAILKAGNRMNAGTARGNAQAFNLTALLKLSDVKSVDGKTTLLNFVVEEVVRSEGKRCVLNRRSHSLTRSGSSNSSGGNNSAQVMSKEEQEKEYLKLGLPIVGGLSSEFSNVKKAASVDYDTVVATCSALAVRAKDARTVIGECEEDGGEGGRFVKKMMTFLVTVEEEVKKAKHEERKVMELVKRTTDYYQAGAITKGKSPLHLFVIVREFLAMVDKACLEIMRNMQRRKIGSSVSPTSQRNAVKFPVLPLNFMSDRARSDSGGSDSDM